MLKRNLKENLNIIVILFCILSYEVSIANVKQEVVLKGKIVNVTTGKPIPFCSINIETSLVGTSTNEEGEFILKVKNIPVKLIISHISFEKKKITLTKEKGSKNLRIKLTPLANILEEVFIENKRRKKDFFAINLARKAINKLKESASKNKFGKAFYRQKSKNDEEYTELSEIIFDTKYTLNGVLDWEIIEGRYALKENKINNKNFTLFSKITKALQPDTDDIYFPLHPQFEQYYEVYKKQTIKNKKGNIIVLKFKPTIKKVPIFNAEVYINEKTKEIYKIKGRVVNDELNLVSFSDKNSEKKGYELSYEISYKKNEALGLVIDYININQEFDFYKKEVKETHTETTSRLIFYEHYLKRAKNRIRNQFARSKSDWEKLNKIGYNHFFWKENPIIKRTPIEDEVIASFEKNNAFESIFINSRNQISFSQKELMKDAYLSKLTAEIKGFNKVKPIEKVYLHTDRDTYFIGEDLWFSGYAMLSENTQNLIASNMMNVDLINQEGGIILSQKVELIGGRVAGTVSIPKDVKSGVYQLRAYTNWMKNFDNDFFFKKNIKIFTNKISERKDKKVSKEFSKTDLQFFPEGGDIIDGLISKVAFKAIGVGGKGKKVRGKVVNDKGIKVANIVSTEKGLGYFKIKPVFGSNYTAFLEDGTMYNLPKVVKSGYSIFANNLSKRSVRLRVQATKDLLSSSFYVVGQMNHRKYFQGKYKFGGKLAVEVEVPKNKLPSGVMTLTVLDENFIPRTERVVFVNNKQEILIKTKLKTRNLKPRDKIDLGIEVTDLNGDPVMSSLSISVTNANKFSKNKFSSNIVTNFLLESDLRGYIEEPEALFVNQEKSTLLRLDLVMLTNGWRKLNLETIYKSNYDTITKYKFIEGIQISGMLKDVYNKPLRNKKFKMIAKSLNKIWVYPGFSDKFGKFKIKDIMQYGLIETVFKVYNSNGDLIESKVILDKQNESFGTPKSNFKYSSNKGLSIEEKEFIKQSIVRNELDSIFKIKNGDTWLDEVVVSGKIKKLKEKKKGRPSNYGVEPDDVIYLKNRSENNIFQLINTMVGVNASSNGNVSIRGGSAPLFVIDGFPIPKIDENIRQTSKNDFDLKTGFKKRNTKAPDIISTFNVSDIERIEMLKGPSAAIYGVNGGNGVILIYTKTANLALNDNIELSKHVIEGTSISKEFYIPKYNVKDPINNKLDYRTTIYWNPLLLTDEKGRAKLSFYNTDDSNKIQISIEGLSLYGNTGAYLKTITKN